MEKGHSLAGWPLYSPVYVNFMLINILKKNYRLIACTLSEAMAHRTCGSFSILLKHL